MCRQLQPSTHGKHTRQGGRHMHNSCDTDWLFMCMGFDVCFSRLILSVGLWNRSLLSITGIYVNEINSNAAETHMPQAMQNNKAPSGIILPRSS